MTDLGAYILIFSVATLLAALATPLSAALGRRLGWVDVAGGRRRHTGSIPRIGGIGLLAGFLGAAALALWLVPLTKPDDVLRIGAVLIGCVFVFVVGLVDDARELSAGPQLAAQVIVAFIAMAGTVWVQEVTLPVFGFRHFPWFVTIPLTLLWIVGMMNTVNWLDGLDGLAAGVGGIAALLFAIHAYRLGQREMPLYPVAVAGACLGFLLFNFSPARTFLGSSGVLPLGFLLATLSILAPARVATALLVLAIPIADTAFQIFDRWRRGQRVIQGDRGHLHFRLVDLGLPPRKIVLGYWSFCALFGALALFIPAPTYKLIALLLLGLIVLALLRRLATRPASEEH